MIRTLGPLLTLGLAPCLYAQCELQKLLADQPDDYDELGVDVALEGSTAFLGSPGDDAPGNASGSVYVFERSSGWLQVDRLTALDGAPFDYFGDAVALSGDLAVVGAFGDDDAGSYTGSAYVFERAGGSWAQVAKLTAGDAEAGDYFGDSVAIDGDVIVIGAALSEDAGLRTGSAYVFERIGGVWTETAKLLASDLHAFHYFGGAVATDGVTVFVGATEANSNVSGPGSVYAFGRSGASWVETQILVPSDGAPNDQFGKSVSLSGQRVLIGSYQDDEGAALAGSAYVFDSTPGGWVESAKLVASDPQGFDAFGFDVALFGDRALIGAFRHDESAPAAPPVGDPPPPYAGVAYIFELSGGGWTESAELVPSDSAHDDRFGYSVALSNDAALGGAPGEGEFGSGAAYVFAELCPVGTVYCSPAVPNTTGLPGTIVASGSEVVLENDLTLVADQLPPGQFGYFITSTTPSFPFMPPGSSGYLCLGGNIGRYNASIGQGPSFTLQIDLTSMPVNPPVPVQPGETYGFQAWYRDAGGTNNFTDAVSVLFQ